MYFYNFDWLSGFQISANIMPNSVLNVLQVWLSAILIISNYVLFWLLLVIVLE